VVQSAEDWRRDDANGEPAPFFIAEPETPTSELLPQDAILFNHVRHGFLLAPIQPAD
jgi:hypothetical protein